MYFYKLERDLVYTCLSVCLAVRVSFSLFVCSLFFLYNLQFYGESNNFQNLSEFGANLDVSQSGRHHLDFLTKQIN